MCRHLRIFGRLVMFMHLRSGLTYVKYISGGWNHAEIFGWVVTSTAYGWIATIRFMSDHPVGVGETSCIATLPCALTLTLVMCVADVFTGVGRLGYCLPNHLHH